MFGLFVVFFTFFPFKTIWFSDFGLLRHDCTLGPHAGHGRTPQLTAPVIIIHHHARAFTACDTVFDVASCGQECQARSHCPASAGTDPTLVTRPEIATSACPWSTGQIKSVPNKRSRIAVRSVVDRLTKLRKRLDHAMVCVRHCASKASCSRTDASRIHSAQLLSESTPGIHTTYSRCTSRLVL